ncbi:uncharacterized protein LOC116303790 [Actinia tenebrosa]|uniref:Uncharacterized protein LOC116303790 n=1 Tax=Actinia tenebrosa TaxID=6105 RepID=A0A6P8IQA1_ACTTE|nr:uncharacterized protein LOC116303790 [Actinia tenebrosa]
MAGLVIGVDVGGTNTDAAIIKNTDFICSGKTPTTDDVTSGLERAINSAIDNLPNGYSHQDIKRVNIGTTHFVNAVVQRKDIVPVAVLRICGPASRSVPPFFDSPPDLKKVIAGPYYYLQGGYEFDGQQVISEVDDEEIRRVAKEIHSKGIRNVVINGVFSSVCAAQENHVRDVILQSYSSISMTLSHEVGLIGYLERENASILNETLKPLCSKTVAAFSLALQRIGLRCPFYLTQNDGTIIRAQKALEFPVLTFASGPTNSMRGAALLSKIKDAIVVDIGGTTSDVGVLNNGFPRQSSTRVRVGGVNTNFRMPDVLSFGLGGGSHVMEDKKMGHITVGPRSVGYKLEKESRVFGGEVLTATDIAVAASLCDLGDRTKVKGLTKDFKMKTLDVIKKMIEDVIDQVKTSKEDQPVVLVGGGSILVDKTWQLKGASSFHVPPHFQAANAVGAALSKISGIVDTVFHLENRTEQEVKKEAEVLAHKKAVENGADQSTIETVEISAIKLAYLPGNVIHIKVKAVGDLSEHELHSSMKDFQNDEAQLATETVQSEPYKPSSAAYSPHRYVQPDEDYQITYATDTTCHSEPTIDPATGDWLLSKFDVECIAIGAGILGCGGGGSLYIGKLRILQLLRSGKEIRIIHPDSVSGPVAFVAFMGAPVILLEKLPSGEESVSAVQALQPREKTGVTGPLHAIASAEVGGMNSLEPLAAAALLGLPVVDADGMGRAFPELQMFIPFVYGVNPYPASIADEKENVLCINKVESSKSLEKFFRVVCIKMGCSAAISALFTPEDIKERFVHFSLSHARKLGKAVLQARKDKTSPVDAILSQEEGKLLYKGKIADLERTTVEGFSRGIITITSSDQEQPLLVEFQNENYLAYTKNEDGTTNILACVPDLISLVDSETGEPIPTEEVRYGLRVAVLAMCSNPLWTTPEGLQTVGPRAFGYKDIEYKPVGKYIEHPPIPKPRTRKP